VTLSYKGNTSTPSIISYNVGRFGLGYLRSWSRLGTLQIGRRGSLSLEADNTLDALDNGGTLTQWLERANVAYQFSPDASFAVGARRIIGVAPTFFTSSEHVDAANLSLRGLRRPEPTYNATRVHHQIHSVSWRPEGDLTRRQSER